MSDYRQERFAEPITDLSPYEGNFITSITAIDKDGKKVDLPDAEFFTVKNGKLECTIYGVIDIKLFWSEWDNCYVELVNWCEKYVLDIRGFIYIETFWYG